MALADALVELQQLTERLRRDCPWDREQTERTIVPHTVEEAYEVADAALAGDDAQAARRARRPALPGLLPRAAALRAGRGRPRGGRARRSPTSWSPATRTSSATSRRRPPARVRAELGAAEGRPGGARGRLPRRPRDAARAAARAQGAAPRGRGRLRLPRPRGRARRPRRRAARAAGRAATASPSAEQRARRRGSRPSSATCSSPASTSRGGSTSIPSSSCAPRAGASAPGSRRPSGSRRPTARRWSELPLDRAGPLLRRARRSRV